MTGYGKAEKEFADKKITVELKSLNSKQMDLSARIVGIYRSKEIELRNKVAQCLLRGKVDLTISVEQQSGMTAGQPINVDVLSGYMEQITRIADDKKIPLPSNWFEVLLRLPDVLKTSTVEPQEEEYQAVYEAVEMALNEINSFRLQEGKSLDRMFSEKIMRIEQLLKEVEEYENERIERIRTRMEDNLQVLAEKVDIDRNRLEQEMIYYIEKLDINEEKLRLRNHLNYFLETLDTGDGVGKKLGFIAQEMGREINTLGSKSNHSEMQIIVVKMKDELEQIKEQVLNVL
jgi:uncharacterized protein (TIGR00255 family)